MTTIPQLTTGSDHPGFELPGRAPHPGEKGVARYHHPHRYMHTELPAEGRGVTYPLFKQDRRLDLPSARTASALGVTARIKNEPCYRSDRVRFSVSNLDRMPTEDGMIEVATCFQTIALVSDQSGEAAELGRALIPESVPLLLMSRAQPQGDTELERNALKTDQLARPDIDRAHRSYLLKIEILTKRQGSGLSSVSLQIAAIESGDSSN